MIVKLALERILLFFILIIIWSSRKKKEIDIASRLINKGFPTITYINTITASMKFIINGRTDRQAYHKYKSIKGEYGILVQATARSKKYKIQVKVLELLTPHTT